MEIDQDEATGARFERLAPEYQAAFARFLRCHYSLDLQRLHARLRQAPTRLVAPSDAPDSLQSFSQRVCAQRLLDFNAQLGTLLFRHPEQLLPLFHAALAKEVACNAGQPLEGGGLPTIPLKARRKLKVRVENLPPVPPLRKAAISAIRSNDVKQLIQIAGTVVRTGMVRWRGGAVNGLELMHLCRLRCRRRRESTSAATPGAATGSWSSRTRSRATSWRSRCVLGDGEAAAFGVLELTGW